MKFVVRVLAVVGALAIVLVVAAGIALWSASRPADEARPATSSDAANSAQGVRIGNVDLTAKGMTSGDDSVTLDGLNATGVVPFSAVAAQAGRDVQLAHDGQGRVRMTTTVEALGRSLQVTAVGDVSAQGREIVVTPDSVDTGAPGVLDDAVGTLARSAVTIRQTVDDLPAGTSISDLTVADDGFHVRLTGDRVTFGR